MISVRSIQKWGRSVKMENIKNEMILLRSVQKWVRPVKTGNIKTEMISLISVQKWGRPVKTRNIKTEMISKRTQTIKEIPSAQKLPVEQSHMWRAASPCCSRSGQRVLSSSLDLPHRWSSGRTSKAPPEKISLAATLSSILPHLCGRASLPDG